MRDLKETSEIIKMDENITENEATLDSLLNEDMNIVKILDEDGKEEYEKINKVEVGSVAEAYCEIVVEKSKRLFPCLSYASKINLSNNKKMGYIIDAPHSRKSWRDYNHENKGSARFNRYSR